MNTESIWVRDFSLPTRRALDGELRADVCVIGAGMAGCLTAYMLKESGAKVVVLEKERVGCGQTSRTTAKITSQHGVIYDSLIRKFGADRAAQYALANELALREYARVIQNQRIACDFVEARSYAYSYSAAEPMEREAEAARGLGLPASFAESAPKPFEGASAVCFERQARFHPLKFLRAISADIEIYERSPAVSIDGCCVETPAGRVNARHVVFTTHYPFINAPGYYFLRMHQERSYALALKGAGPIEHMFYGADADGVSLREAGGLAVLCGASHRTGENSTGERYARLLERASDMWPNCREVARWSAQDCVTLDGVPYIGRFSRARDDWHVATGFEKWGMTSSMAAAVILRDSICQKAPDWAEVFSPERFSPRACARSMRKDGVASARGLLRQYVGSPEIDVSELKPGHGGITRIDGRKAGAYRDERGELHVVDTRCPHLGCQLEWNPDELTWDCPCHGSRFTMDGEWLNDPAQQPLKRP